MAWVVIILNSCTELHLIISVTMNAEINRDKVLDTYVKLFKGAIDNFHLMNDNARPNLAALMTIYLEGEGIQRISGLHIMRT